MHPQKDGVPLFKYEPRLQRQYITTTSGYSSVAEEVNFCEVTTAENHGNYGWGEYSGSTVTRVEWYCNESRHVEIKKSQRESCDIIDGTSPVEYKHSYGDILEENIVNVTCD